MRAVGGPQAAAAAELYREAADDIRTRAYSRGSISSRASQRGPGKSASGAVGGPNGAELVAAAAANLALSTRVNIEPMDM